ncbi:MAG: hypothetical protein UX02_C0002G0213 [Candidatus Moranbacteria bacterium GW2011_GWC1_45_18]|nr:MAG: hypothetical protein UT79_C0001G0248 [Candidatus Moranbacteria bacterium GW2011_GWC2_40_12]KKT33407.1 MAG: hypothetical protein UW19_C0009G0053 [Candidatus Moranbacteria bacterium GW2011_GWF2_44_10]KKT72237.1 MAG: hypothetical protein UW66_C0009G0009 [Candidatus Moranbacteria bacterium GW2011_GWF1_44_4]KKT99894.1 MAG: hypothetical protein UX02_C0002G0213 [Candidatus Moranbacteria bacterium GW2011_GWC1_45_18]OGI24570.1 MAG: hypothetical protein A2194_03450 [Candidatus Moranbacteria bacte
MSPGVLLFQLYFLKINAPVISVVLFLIGVLLSSSAKIAGKSIGHLFPELRGPLVVLAFFARPIFLPREQKTPGICKLFERVREEPLTAFAGGNQL